MQSHFLKFAKGLFVLCGILFFSSAAPAQTPIKSYFGSQQDQPRPRPVFKYQGFGAQSLAPEIVKRFLPRPIDPQLRREIESETGIHSPGGAHFSPDGKILYFHWNVSGAFQIWKLALTSTAFPVQMTAGEDRTFLFDITPDGSSLIEVRDHGGDEYAGIYRQKASGGRLEPLFVKSQVKAEPQFITENGRYLYFISNEKAPTSYGIYRLNLSSLEREVILEKPGLWNVADHRPDGTLLISRHTAHDATEFFLLPANSTNPVPLFGQGDHDEYQGRFGSHKDEVLVLTNKFGEYRRLYSYRNQQFTPLTPDLSYDVSGFQLDFLRQRILYNLNEAGIAHLGALDAKTYRALKVPALPGSLRLEWGCTTRDSRRSMVVSETTSKPTEAFIYDWKTTKLEKRLEPSMPELDTSGYVEPQLTTYPARDGTPIPLIVWRKAVCELESCPVIVIFHGGPNMQTSPRFDPEIQFLLKKGFTVLEPNVRGSEGYGKSWQKADDGPKRLNVIADIADIADYARHAFKVGDPVPKVGAFGFSYGGYSVLMGMTMFAGKFDAGFEIIGIADLRSYLKNTAAYRAQLRISEYGDPDKDRAVIDKLSPVSYLNRVKGPIMIVHGLNDPKVPVGESYDLYTRLEERGQQPELIIFPNEGHGVEKLSNRVLLQGYAYEFFKAHLHPKEVVK
jgi:dipeptidyl aminopeptidase/acylaminoacyl peptidase